MLNDTMIEPAERELTDLIYAALLGEKSWQEFLDRLNALIPGGVSTLFFHDQKSGEGGISLAAGLDADTARDYAAYYVGLNPWMHNVARTPLGTGIIGERIVPRDAFVRTEYYADFLRRREIEAGVGVTLWREETCSFLLSTLTTRIDPEENQHVADLLTRLSPHLTRAFRYYRTGRSGGALAQFGGSLLDTPDVAVIVVGEGMRLRAASPRAEALLSAGTVVGLTAMGTLRLRDEASAALLKRMLSRGYTGPRSRVVHLGAYRLTLVKAEAEGATGYFSGLAATLILEEARPADAPDIGWLARSYGLSPAERRVAEGIAAGLTPIQVAERGGTGLETVRGQLKAVYAKTGVNSQAGLVRIAFGFPPPR
ncbi:helix-turn-helix transcriptional regulator [Bosea sp. (in: a-proteobacteria)]|uniref:helix-turn-helix transcriptional regulator n=1 Tax=Bosea sp. (in: a-proteobacteria) TaxID=1871050 RepID=UPI001AD420D8|nr:helix-turn-helix transcriptional regulator [Bosea sp. (in: a-proteobacteria)]MBN9438127.1 helix-turn-helix transcriptional regulator [Bosea sp. (in: a-proteobacteria)]